MHFFVGQSVHYIWPWGLARGRGMCLFVFYAPPVFLERRRSKQALCLHAPHGLTSTKQSQPSERETRAPSVSVQSGWEF